MKNEQPSGIPFCPTCGGEGYYGATNLTARRPVERRLLGMLTRLKILRKRCWCARYSMPSGVKLIHWMDEGGDGPGTLTYAIKRLLVEAELVPDDVVRIKWYFGQWMNAVFPPKTQAMWWQTVLAEADDNASLLLFYRVAKSEGVDSLFMEAATE